MTEKKSGLKKLFSKSSKKDCCSIEIEEVKSHENSNYGTVEENNQNQQKQS
ncbi:hypothetical protein [Salibacterium salarium]|uniref:hypothetical protein n=1 Tax=Salibacterium salarium TaxID=284579 RepID=UPI00163B14A7|nr:hypothetical protein [Salibacterium salarium]